MAGLAVSFLIAYGAIALGARMLIQLRRTGSTGFKGLSGRPGSAEWIGGVLFASAIVLAPLGVVLDLQDALGPVDALDGDYGRAAGVALAAGGLLATVLAQAAMGDAWRVGVDPGERTELVTAGPFAHVRNPIYSGMLPFFAGIALLSPNPVTLLAAALLLVALELQVRLVEEPHLLRTHGQAYADYAGRTGRFFPGVGRLR